MMVPVLCRGERFLIEMPSYSKMQLNDDERLIVVAAINKFRSEVSPPAANMLALVSQHFYPLVRYTGYGLREKTFKT